MYKDVLVSLHITATCVLLLLSVQLKELIIRILLQ